MSYTKVKTFKIHHGVSGTFYPSDPAHPTFAQSRVIADIVRTRTGDNMPGWRQKIRDEQNATTFLTGVYDTLDVSTGSVESQRFYGLTQTVLKENITGQLALETITVPNWANLTSTSAATNRVVQQYLKKVRSAVQGTSAPIFLGELKETLHMLRHPMQGLHDLGNAWLHNVKSMKKKKPLEWKKNLSSAWLEQSFGWQPLISDVKDIINTYHRIGEREKVIPIKAYGVDSADAHVSTPRLGGYGWAVYLLNVKSYERCVIKYVGKVVVQMKTTEWDNAALFGFNIREFAPTAWELLPWSFLVDYFSNVGDIVEGLATETRDLRWTCGITNVIKTVECYAAPDKARFYQSAPSPISIGGKASTAKWERRTVTRGTIGTVGIPSLQFELPGRPGQWSNMTALFAQANSVYPQNAYRPFRR
jgi:hypothetical protein